MKVGIASGDWIHPDRSPNGDPYWGGSGWARLGQYVPLLDFDVCVGVLTWTHDHFYIADVEGTLHDPEVIIMQRLMHEGLIHHIPRAQAYGQKIINDMDDWYWGISPSNQAFHVNHPKSNPNENTNHYRKVLAVSDLVTVSTPYLMDRLSAFVRHPMVLVPNYVDVSRFNKHPVSPDSPPTVGWVGSTAHRSGDLETARGWLAPMAKRGEVLLYHGGHSENGLSFATYMGVPEEMVRTKPMVPAHEYPSLLDMDIGIIPLSPVPFNEAKSDIKGLEYAAAGIPFVAQSTGSYRSLRDNYGIGLVADRATDWVKNIKKLFEPSYREELSQEWLSKIHKRHINNGVEQLNDIIRNIRS